MKKESNIIVRVDKDLKEEIQSICSKSGINLSSLINAYLLDTAQRGDVPINIRAKAGKFSKAKTTISIPKIKKLLEEAIAENKYSNEIEKAYLFGSYARGEETSSSDVDIRIITKKDGKFSLFDLGNLRLDLVEKLGIDVDLIIGESDRFDPVFYNEIKKDEICIYGK